MSDDGNSVQESEESQDQYSFALLSGDRHAPALIRLWAEMREKEGESPEVVNEAREIAQLMEDDMLAQGATVLSLDAVASFAATLREEKQQAQVAAAGGAETQPATGQLREGDIVVAVRGRPAKLVKIYPNDNELARGKADIHVPGQQGPVTVEFHLLRRALPEEIEAYRNSGGRM